MKQLKKKIIVVSVATGICASMYAGYVPKEATASVTDEMKDTYIVQMENSDALEEISEKYGTQVSDDSESYENLENENCIVLDLTKSQAASLSDADGIDFLESNLEMQGAVADMASVSECETEWNINMVNANLEDNTKEVKDNDNPVKIAVIDSGIDYTNEINVVKRKNFIPGEDDISILYEDVSGHGTSVAGIIAASGEENKDQTGIAKNAEIYSAKVLDANNKAPISRVAEGIYWAIEQGVDIINLSLGTSKPSELLEKAVKDAYDKGILLIASAGNNEKAGVEYPAAYDEVMAVASVDSLGEHSSRSAVGDEVEIAAPGEKVKTASCFDGEIVVSGTSIATPHITAIAARLWEKDRTKSAQFIRGLIDASANSVGEKSEYGYGIADLSYAMEIYDKYAKDYVESTEVSVEETLESIEDVAEKTDNDASIEMHENDYVEGRWAINDHKELAGLGSLKQDDLKVLKWGAYASDVLGGFEGMKVHPYFHGFGYGANVFVSGLKKTNYISSYILLTKMAVAFKDGYSDPAKVRNQSDYDYKMMCKCVNASALIGFDKYDNTYTHSWTNILKETKDFPVTRHNKSLFLYGMALHTATDSFAHSTFVNEKRLTHADKDDADYLSGADIKDNYPNRYNCAKVVAKKLLLHADNGEIGILSDWVIPTNTYKGVFKLIGLSYFANEVNEEFYKKNRKNFDDMNCVFYYYQDFSGIE